MKKISPTKILFGFLGLATFASLVGSISGSLAWYAYSTRASLSYSGTSVERTAQLQIGVVSPVAINFAANEMVEDTTITDVNNNHYYFAPLGSGLTTTILGKYLEANGYANNYLIPVTSGSYQSGDGFSLKKAPMLGSADIKNNVASEKDQYASFQFVFRIPKGANSNVTEYVADREIWLTDAKARRSTTNDGNVFKSIRIYVDRLGSYTSDYIFNPSASEAGATRVGGLLDLGRDKTYDYDANNNEIIYGEYDESIADSKRFTNYQGTPGDENPIDVNGSNYSGYDTFTARHEEGVNYYTKESLAECGIKTAQYYSLSDISPVRNAITGELTNPTGNVVSICKTDATDSYLGRVNMTVYLEGWDFTVVDEEVEHLFDIGLTFEINKVAAND